MALRKRRPPPRMDHYEATAERIERNREAEQVGAPVPPPPGLDYPLPPRFPIKALLIIFVVLFLCAIVRARSGASPPHLAKSCTVAAVKLSAGSTSRESLVRWAAVGPPTDNVAIGIDIARFEPGPRGLEPVPLPGHALT